MAEDEGDGVTIRDHIDKGVNETDTPLASKHIEAKQKNDVQNMAAFEHLVSMNCDYTDRNEVVHYSSETSDWVEVTANVPLCQCAIKLQTNVKYSNIL